MSGGSRVTRPGGGVQGEELVIDESQAAIEPLPNRERAPLPQPPSTPGMFSPHINCASVSGRQ